MFGETEKDVTEPYETIDSLKEQLRKLHEKVFELNSMLLEKGREAPNNTQELFDAYSKIRGLENENKMLREELSKWVVVKRNHFGAFTNEAKEARERRINKIKEEVKEICEHYGWDKEFVLNATKSRKKEYVAIRAALAVHYKEDLDYKLQEISSGLGYKEHSSIINLIEKAHYEIKRRNSTLIKRAWQMIADYFDGVQNDTDLWEDEA